jgi:hypothetical protein
MLKNKKIWIFYCLLGLLILSACSQSETEISVETPIINEQPDRTNTIPIPTEVTQETAIDTSEPPTEAVEIDPTDTPKAKDLIPGLTADVISASVSGQPGEYNFAVTISSPDEGCHQYADWWEVLNPEGELIYRRILLHSHVDEQPFTRSGGPVPIEASTIVLVRAHMHPFGYGGTALKGSPEQGFEEVDLSDDFASDLVEILPLPEGCNF